MSTAITIRYILVLFILLSVIVSITDCYINSIVSMSVVNSRKKNIVKNKKDIPYRKFANENEKYLYGNYLVTLRKFKRTINYSKLLNNITNSIVDNINSSIANYNKTTSDTGDVYLNIKNNTIINNDQFIAKNIILANIKIDVSTVKYIQITTKNDTITIELDKNNDNMKSKDIAAHITDTNGFINYDLGKIDSLISAISILMNLLNIH
jgi:hypothetical protein